MRSLPLFELLFHYLECIVFFWMLSGFFSLCLVINNFTMVGFFIRMLLGVHWDSWICKFRSFSYFGKFGAITFSSSSLCGHFFWVFNYTWYCLSDSWNSLHLFPQTPANLFFPLCSSDRIISSFKVMYFFLCHLYSANKPFQWIFLFQILYISVFRISLFYTFCFCSGTSYLFIYYQNTFLYINASQTLGYTKIT